MAGNPWMEGQSPFKVSSPLLRTIEVFDFYQTEKFFRR